MIECAGMIGGVYYFDEVLASHEQVQGLSGVCPPSVKETIVLRHCRLGHPNFFYLKYLFLDLFKGLDCSFFQCASCIFSKHHRSTFLPKPYKASSPFSLIHKDIWSPFKVLTHNGNHWFLTFIDDHTLLTWLYLLTNKLEIKVVFVRFYNMIETRFLTKIRILHFDNGIEYFN